MDLSEIYQDLIIEHGTDPRNFYELENPTNKAEGFNPLCGDKVNIFLKINNNIIEDISFTGEGCAISMASASIMTETLKGMDINKAKELFHDFKISVTEDDINSTKDLGKISALAGVKAFPARVKCATMAWHTMNNAVNK